MDFSCMHFYKHMSGFFMHSISMPERLTRQLAHLVGKLLELKGPSGSTWYVGRIRSGKKLVLQPGWNDFASANNISQNDLLVFKFVGGLNFEVFLFDPTGCEKGSILLEKEEHKRDESFGSTVGEELSKELHQFDMKEKDEWTEIHGEIKKGTILCRKGKLHKIKGEAKMQLTYIATKPPSKKFGINEKEDAETSNGLVPIGKLPWINTQKKKQYCEIQGEMETLPMKRPCRNPSESPLTKGQERNSLQSCYIDYTSGIPWTAKQKSRSQQLACKVKDRNPYFHKILARCNLISRCRMCIPAKFVADHLKREKTDFILYIPDQGKTWVVTSHCCQPRHQLIIEGTNWVKFLMENKLQQGDLCLFELVKTAKQLTFVVHISRSTNTLDS